MNDNEMYVRNFITGALLVLFFTALIVAGIQVHEYQQQQQMEACVKSGKEWTVIKPDAHSSNIERVCLEKKS